MYCKVSLKSVFSNFSTEIFFPSVKRMVEEMEKMKSKIDEGKYII